MALALERPRRKPAVPSFVRIHCSPLAVRLVSTGGGAFGPARSISRNQEESPS